MAGSRTHILCHLSCRSGVDLRVEALPARLLRSDGLPGLATASDLAGLCSSDDLTDAIEGRCKRGQIERPFSAGSRGTASHLRRFYECRSAHRHSTYPL
jgi:hypothetical protein